jgi:hypothetical protein
MGRLRTGVCSSRLRVRAPLGGIGGLGDTRGMQLGRKATVDQRSSGKGRTQRYRAVYGVCPVHREKRSTEGSSQLHLPALYQASNNCLMLAVCRPLDTAAAAASINVPHAAHGAAV